MLTDKKKRKLQVAWVLFQALVARTNELPDWVDREDIEAAKKLLGLEVKP